MLFVFAHVFGTLFFYHEVDTSFLSSFHFLSYDFLSFLGMGIGGVTLMGAEVLYLSSCYYAFLLSFSLHPSPSFLPHIFNF
ncbi:hypothetical protein HOY80DRAFT_982765 [Tuber brumale]|nr:hypothetical protein HOY80DRAFT_982765 [Tuber brumale]